mmetsp:Transcript_1925/g.3933  ORF Transcript_1925/g.3933 Transcript_1925/m.3933 type:complete len:317 (+) Transcript_1925:3964-4914(+)
MVAHHGYPTSIQTDNLGAFKCGTTLEKGVTSFKQLHHTTSCQTVLSTMKHSHETGGASADNSNRLGLGRQDARAPIYLGVFRVHKRLVGFRDRVENIVCLANLQILGIHGSPGTRTLDLFEHTDTCVVQLFAGHLSNNLQAKQGHPQRREFHKGTVFKSTAVVQLNIHVALLSTVNTLGNVVVAKHRFGSNVNLTFGIACHMHHGIGVCSFDHTNTTVDLVVNPIPFATFQVASNFVAHRTFANYLVQRETAQLSLQQGFDPVHEQFSRLGFFQTAGHQLNKRAFVARGSQVQGSTDASNGNFFVELLLAVPVVIF